MEAKKIYVIHYSDPRPSKYHPDGRDDICWDKGAFTDKTVAEGVMSGMKMFQETDDETVFSVRELTLHEDTDFGTWIAREMGNRRAG